MSYPDGAVVRVEDLGPLELAYAEALHEDCVELPAGHPLADHSPWSGGDLDGAVTWPEFVATMARHGLEVVRVPEVPEGHKLLVGREADGGWWATSSVHVDGGLTIISTSHDGSLYETLADTLEALREALR